MNRKRIANIAAYALAEELKRIKALERPINDLYAAKITDTDIDCAIDGLRIVFENRVRKLEDDIHKAELWGNNEPVYRLNEKVRTDDYGDRITTYEIICIYDNKVEAECDTIHQAVEWIQRND